MGDSLPRLTIRQKAERALSLLLGLRHPEVAEVLAQSGFEQADIDDGFERIKALTSGTLERRAPRESSSQGTLAQLDAWENRWFPVIDASLKARHPQAHEWLVGRLRQASGILLAPTMMMLVERLVALPEEPSLGAEGKAARALLEKRGLTAAVLQEAVELTEGLRRPESSRPHVAPDVEGQRKAEAALWAWYLEWSTIARAGIKDKRLLRECGLSAGKKAAREAAAAAPWPVESERE